MVQENIKTKVCFHHEGQSRPFASTEDFETLKRFHYITEKSEYETDLDKVDVNGKTYSITEVKISILKETSDFHLKYGIDTTLSGEPMPYNFRVSVYLKKK